MIDLENLKKSLSQLELHCNLAIIEKDEIKKFAFQTAAIQSFEYTYESATKILKRFLRENLTSEEEVKLASFKELIRTAAEAGLIDEVKAWFDYREKRNITSHTYDQEESDKVFSILPSFIKEVKKLLTKLQENDIAS